MLTTESNLMQHKNETDVIKIEEKTPLKYTAREKSNRKLYIYYTTCMNKFQEPPAIAHSLALAATIDNNLQQS